MIPVLVINKIFFYNSANLKNLGPPSYIALKTINTCTLPFRPLCLYNNSLNLKNLTNKFAKKNFTSAAIKPIKNLNKLDQL